jgi:hypothetical protein
MLLLMRRFTTIEQTNAIFNVHRAILFMVLIRNVVTIAMSFATRTTTGTVLNASPAQMEDILRPTDLIIDKG